MEIRQWAPHRRIRRANEVIRFVKWPRNDKGAPVHLPDQARIILSMVESYHLQGKTLTRAELIRALDQGPFRAFATKASKVWTNHKNLLVNQLQAVEIESTTPQSGAS